MHILQQWLTYGCLGSIDGREAGCMRAGFANRSHQLLSQNRQPLQPSQYAVLRTTTYIPQDALNLPINNPCLALLPLKKVEARPSTHAYKPCIRHGREINSSRAAVHLPIDRQNVETTL